MILTIRERLWGSFLVLVLVFVVNGIIAIVILTNNNRLSQHIANVIDPAQQSLQDFKGIIVESKMYTTNWVFLRYNQEDKDALKRLQTNRYPQVRKKLLYLLPQLGNKKITDSITRVFDEFEQLILSQQFIMTTLARFEHYDDPIFKMMSEQAIEDEIIPKTTKILNELNQIAFTANKEKVKKYNELRNYAIRLRTLITLLSVSIIVLGIFLSVYFIRVITYPINKMKKIINDLGKGIINKVDHTESKDEIGGMVSSVNNLSEKLQETARFAEEVGNRNFSLPFSPLSEQDKLGKALLTMRDNIKTGEESLLETSDSLMRRNQALEQYTFIVSHNLRAPVATIIGLSELLDSGHISRDDMQDVLSGLKISAQKLDNVIHDLNVILQVNQQIHEMTHEVSLQELFNETRAMFGKSTEQTDISFKCDFSAAPTITTLKTYLVSILYNLISNSIKYRRTSVPLLIEVKSYCDAGNIIILFRDNGKGIDMERNGEKLFRLYERFDYSVEGKGMGLFMMKTQVDNLNGSVSVQSEIDKGTEFRIEFPLS